MAFELGTDGPQVIVVGYDATEPADHALAYATGLARRQGATLVVAFATPSYVIAAMGATVDACLAGVSDSIQQDIQHQVQRHMRDTGVAWRFVAGNGDPVRLLESVAEESQADAVIVGHSQHREHRFVGSVAIRLVRSAKWPTIVVP
ncbi:MAG TPA: universal stress protein [Mycobacteriales bacterium]|nr:universal stress protein [Mycobacteriales bacterium]